MRLFGFQISRAKAITPTQPAYVEGVWNNPRQWMNIIREPFTGAWQRNMEERFETVTAYYAVYSCVTLIASDISKCRIRLVEKDRNGIWLETESPAFSPVLRKPNRYQNRIKFFEQWVVSKLLHGNTYALKGRDDRRVVKELYILDPTRTTPHVAPNGDVFYQLSRDNLAGVEESNLMVPASEIIHDVMVPLYHPLCGVSPLTASGLAAMQGLAIQRNSTGYFANGSRPGGILTAPGAIDDPTAERLKKAWEENFGGANSGRTAVLGDGLKFEAMAFNSVDSQLIEQLKMTGEMVCSTFHVPAYKAGVGPPPAYNNIEALEQAYYSQCLQKLFECIELCLDEGLGLDTTKEGKTLGTEFDLDDLLRMDTATMVDAESKAVGAGIKAPDEARKRLNLGPVPGGNSPMIQQQNYSLEALAKRDASDDPFGTAKAVSTPAPDQAAEPPADEGATRAFDMLRRNRKLFEGKRAA